MEVTVNNALEGAKWKVDPGIVTENLKSAWQNIEFGNSAAAAPVVKKSLASKKPEVKNAAEKLNAVIQADFDAQLAEAKHWLGKDQKWKAFQIYTALGQNYKGYDLPADAAETKKELASDPAIKREQTAFKTLDKIKKTLTSDRPGARKQAMATLEKLVKDKNAPAVGAEANDLIVQLVGVATNEP